MLAPGFARGADDGNRATIHQAGREPPCDDSVRRSRNPGAPARGRRSVSRVGANESAFGASPKAAEGDTRGDRGRFAWYNDPEGYELRSAIAARSRGAGRGGAPWRRYRRDARQRGADGRRAGDAGGHLARGIPDLQLPRRGLRRGARSGALPRRPESTSKLCSTQREGSMRRSCTSPTPTIRWAPGMTPRDLRAFIDALPESTLLVLGRGVHRVRARVRDVPDRCARPQGHPHEDVLEGARHGPAPASGYAVAPAGTITGVGKVRNHFGVNRIAQAAALASFNDSGFIASVVEEVARGARRIPRARPAGWGARLGAVGDELRGHRRWRLRRPRSRPARAAPGPGGCSCACPVVAPLDRCIRVTVGTSRERALFADIFERALDEEYRAKTGA